MQRKGLELVWNNGTESLKKYTFFFTVLPFLLLQLLQLRVENSLLQNICFTSQKKKDTKRGSRGFFILSHLQEAGFSAQTEVKIDEMWHLLHGRENEHKLRADMTMFATQDSRQLYILMLYVLIYNLCYKRKRRKGNRGIKNISSW